MILDVLQHHRLTSVKAARWKKKRGKKMAIWRPIKPAQMKAVSTLLKRSFFQIHTPYGMYNNNTSSLFKITVCNFPSVPHQRSQFDITKTNLRSYAAPAQFLQKKDDKSDGVRLNEEIDAAVVRLVTEEGHTVMPIRRALEKAKSLKLDLVEVQRNATPPVCKIMDYNKETYQKIVKGKERDKEKGQSGSKLKAGDCKEVRFCGKITQKDLQIKADMVKRLMEKGHRVKCLAVGKTNKQTGAAEDSKTLISRFLSLIEDTSVIESDSRLSAKKETPQQADEDDNDQPQQQTVERDASFVIVRHRKYGPLKKGSLKVTAKNDKSPSTTTNGKENLGESNPNPNPNPNPPEIEYANRQKTPSSVSSPGVPENRYLKNSRDRSSQPDGRTPLRNNNNNSSPFPTQPQFNGSSPQIQNPRTFAPRQGDNNDTVREPRQEPVFNRYKVKNPAESARGPRPPPPRINPREEGVDKDQQGRWGVFSAEGSNSRVPDRRS